LQVPYRSSLSLMVSLVRDGVVSPLELVDAHLEQIARRNPELNAFVEVFDEPARHGPPNSCAASGEGCSTASRSP
jgi:Asp-tRNA(Asn)/Glu-tRNA(Gln) amidotransferase A subunit family amidase